MHPWLLQNPPLSTYGICLVLAFVLAWLWARRRARAAGMEPSRLDLMMPLVLGAGLAGAWIGGVATDAMTAAPAHSSVLVSALLAGTAAGIFYARLIRLPLGILGDILAPPLALGVGIGRVGCFFAGCCFGRECAAPGALTGVQFPAGSFAALAQGANGPSLAVYPVQLYECGLCLLLALVLWRWRARDQRGVTGQKFLALAVGYGIIRFLLEFLRGDNPPIGGLSFSQWACAGVFLLAGVTWMVRLMNARRWHLTRPQGVPGLPSALIYDQRLNVI